MLDRDNTYSRNTQVSVCVTFMVGGAVRGGEGGKSATATLEMVSSSCLLETSEVYYYKS